jgi:7-cyano-7-deazaguanine synthase
LVCNQIECHPFLNQDKVISACRKHGMAVVAYSPIARGSAKDNKMLEKIGKAHGKTAAQVCLRWLVQQGIVVIPRTSRVERLEENLMLFDFELSDAEMREIAGLARVEDVSSIGPGRRTGTELGALPVSISTDTALVLFSGGQDSTVCLAWAVERFARVETVGFDYGQRHAVELSVRTQIREKMAALNAAWKARLGEDHLIKLDALAAISDTALTRETAIAIADSGLPTTFVPGRNLIFFCFAGALAYRRGARHMIAGMCETDYSGYPDCRDDTVKAIQVALSLGLDKRVTIHTPLMWVDKADTFAMAEQIGGKAFLDLVIEDSHSCYMGDRAQRHEWGYGCGTCPACKLRAEGFAKFRSRRKT